MKIINFLFFLSMIYGVEIQLVDGNTINGEIISNSDTKMTIKTSYSEDLIELDKSQILNISFDSSDSKKSNSEAGYQGINKRDIQSAGKSLSKFRSQYYTGTIMQFLGYVLAASEDGDGDGTAPILLVIIGGLMQLTSFNHAGEAGEHLERSIDPDTSNS
mgnify:CR=1 FL=1